MKKGNRVMDKGQVISKLREHRDELTAAGIVHLCAFGSVARGEATPSVRQSAIEP
jgi:predicted nucleotidyltransferase